MIWFGHSKRGRKELPALLSGSNISPVQHDGALCAETRQKHLVSSGYDDSKTVVFVSSALLVPGILMMLLAHLWFIAILMCAFVAVLLLSLKSVDPRIAAITHGKGILVRGTISKFQDGMIFEISDGQYAICPARSPYYKPLQYLCREKPYESDFCVYYDVKTNVPILAFRDADEMFALNPIAHTLGKSAKKVEK